MRILLPSIVDPWTHAGGAAAATRGLLALLGAPPLDATVDVVVPGSPLPHVVRQVVALARSAVSALPSKALFVETAAFHRRLHALASRRAYDLVLINGNDLLGARGALPIGTPTVLYVHNLEHDLYASQLDQLPPLVRACLRSDLDKLTRFEHAGMRAVDGVLFISTDDRARAVAGGLTTPYLHLPPLFAYEPLPRPPRPPTTPIRLGFLANFDWWPNRVGLAWLLRDVLRHVTRDDLRLHLFGTGSERHARADRRVIAHGFVTDVARVFAACDVMLCPIHTGAGVNVKFAEALYNGVPVLGTCFAARGLPRADAKGVHLADEADAWVRILSSPTVATLGRERPSPATARAFAPATHARTLRAFLAEVSAPTRHGRADLLGLAQPRSPLSRS